MTGIVRRRLFVSGSACWRRAVRRNSMRSSRTKPAHVGAADNLRRLLIRACPDAFWRRARGPRPRTRLVLRVRRSGRRVCAAPRCRRGGPRLGARSRRAGRLRIAARVHRQRVRRTKTTLSAACGWRSADRRARPCLAGSVWLRPAALVFPLVALGVDRGARRACRNLRSRRAGRRLPQLAHHYDSW